MCEGVGEDSGHGHDESHLIHSNKISCLDWHVLLRMCVLLCEHDIACARRWRVTLVGFYSTRLCSPRRGTPFQVV